MYIYIIHTYVRLDIIYTHIHAMQKTFCRKGNVSPGDMCFPLTK